MSRSTFAAGLKGQMAEATSISDVRSFKVVVQPIRWEIVKYYTSPAAAFESDQITSALVKIVRRAARLAWSMEQLDAVDKKHVQGQFLARIKEQTKHSQGFLFLPQLKKLRKYSAHTHTY